MPDDNIGDRAPTAVGWRALSQFSSQGITIVTSIILARLLMPDDFGIIGMAGIVTGLAGVFRDLGFGQALVQRPELGEEHKRAAFWVTLIMAGLLYGGVYLVAPYAGEYFRDERMVPVLRIMALSFLIAPFGVVPRSLLQRELDFKRPFIAGLAATIVYGGVGITSAVLGYGYWSLVWALLASSAVGTVAICIITRYAPPLIPSLRGARDLVAFGGGVTGVSLLNYVATRVDYLVIGRLLSASALGLYTKAYQLITYPLGLLAGTFYPVLFPSFSRLKDDLPRTRAAFARTLTLLSVVGFPPLALLAVCAPELIPLVLGEQWRPAVLPVQILVPAGMIKILGNPGGALVKAQGRVYSEMWRQGVRAGLLTVGSWIGAQQGIEDVCIAILCVGVVGFSLSAQLVHSCTGFGALHYARAVRGPVVVSIGAGAAAMGVRMIANAAGIPMAWTLVATLVTGAVAIAAIAWLTPCPELRDTRAEMLRMVRQGMTTLTRT